MLMEPVPEEQKEEPKEEKKGRANYLPAPGAFILNQACVVINKAFDHYGGFCYLVGSCLVKHDFRDVDVRYIMDDEGYDRLFGNAAERGAQYNALWSILCVSISHWLATQTGLNIDFQIQRRTQANESDGRATGKGRNALGIFLDYPGWRPSEVELPVKVP